MLERVWRKGNPLILLVGMQTSMATMEDSMEIPLKTGNRTHMMQQSTAGQIFKEKNNNQGMLTPPSRARHHS